MRPPLVLTTLLLALAGAAPGAPLFQLVREKNAPHREERYLSDAVQRAGLPAPTWVEPKDLDAVLAGGPALLIARHGVEPSNFREPEGLRKWIEAGGTLWVEHGSLFLLRYMKLASIKYQVWLPTVMDSAYFIEPIGLDHPPGLFASAPRTLPEVLREDRLIGTLTEPGIYGFPSASCITVPHRLHAYACVAVTPGYDGWVPESPCLEFPWACVGDAHALRSDEEQHVFPQLPYVLELSVGDGKVFVYHLPFSTDFWKPGAGADTVRGAWLRRLAPISGEVSPTRVAPPSEDAVPTATPSVTPTVTPTATAAP